MWATWVFYALEELQKSIGGGSSFQSSMGESFKRRLRCPFVGLRWSGPCLFFVLSPFRPNFFAPHKSGNVSPTEGPRASNCAVVSAAVRFSSCIRCSEVGGTPRSLDGFFHGKSHFFLLGSWLGVSLWLRKPPLFSYVFWVNNLHTCRTYAAFLSHRATPSHHPFYWDFPV